MLRSFSLTIEYKKGNSTRNQSVHHALTFRFYKKRLRFEMIHFFIFHSLPHKNNYLL